MNTICPTSEAFNPTQEALICCSDVLPDEPTETSMLSHQIDRYLTNLFLQIGIPANKLGYRFLCESIHAVLEEPALQHKLMHGLYPLVAQRFDTSVYMFVPMYSPL